jgi:hypothetical protein
VKYGASGSEALRLAITASVMPDRSTFRPHVCNLHVSAEDRKLVTEDGKPIAEANSEPLAAAEIDEIDRVPEYRG